MKKTILLALVAGAAALMFAADAYAQVYVDADGDGINDNAAFMHRRGGFFGRGTGELRGLMANLTDEQKAEIQATVEALKAEGATPEQIHAAVGEKLVSFGVTLPEGWNVPPPFRGLVANLTDEQKAEIDATIAALVAEGATREQIHQAVGEKLESFGVTLPEYWNTPPHLRGLLNRLGTSLTDAQKAELAATIDAMRAEGATREQIHTAIGEKLQSYGITLPTNWDAPLGPRAEGARLTAEQRAEIQTLVQSLKAEGKTV